MHPEPPEYPPDDAVGSVPSAAARARVLSHCRRAMEARVTARRRKQRWQWSFTAGAAALLLLNVIQEQRIDGRIAAIVARREKVVQAPLPPGAIRSFHARLTLLAALLRDPDAL